MAVLELTNLVKTYPARRGGAPNTVLHGIDLDIRGQQFVSIVGPSGCGKSTLLNIISGVEPYTGGSMVLTDDQGRPARLGYVFQDARLLPWRTVEQNLMFVQESQSQQSKATTLKYLDAVGLADYADYFPSQLSGGMQQRVGIARAFGVEPDLLLMDEPFSHLDAITARGLRAQLQEVWERTKRTVVFVTHDVLEAVQLSDRIIVLAKGGRIVEDITVDMPRPRKLSDERFAALQANILRRLEQEIDIEEDGAA
jgi:NitT/TauT family transport system ATP-binding protein